MWMLFLLNLSTQPPANVLSGLDLSVHNVCVCMCQTLFHILFPGAQELRTGHTLSCVEKQGTPVSHKLIICNF